MAKHIANLGGLASIFVVSSFGRGEAVIELSSEFIRTPINEALMELESTWVPVLDGSLSTSAFEQAVMDIKSQFNFIHITQYVSASQSSSDEVNLVSNLQHNISIQSTVKRVTDQSVTQELTVSQDTPSNLITELEVSQIVTALTAVASNNTVQIIDILEFNVNLVRDLQSDLEITSEISGFKVFANGGIVPIPESDPVDTQVCETISRASQFTITEPLSTDSVSMRHPIIGDILEVNALTVDRNSRGNVDLSFVPTLLNKYIVRRMKFESINTTIKNALQSFLRQHAGLRMSIITPEGTIIFGYVTNLDTLFIDQSINNPSCADDGLWEFELIFVKEVV